MTKQQAVALACCVAWLLALVAFVLRLGLVMGVLLAVWGVALVGGSIGLLVAKPFGGTLTEADAIDVRDDEPGLLAS
jgi:hypothetical protein